MISINLHRLYKHYSESSVKWAVKDINLEIFTGEFFCLIGPSGCGKSTVLKLIGGLEKPSSGKVELLGSSSLVFQSGALFPWLSVADNVAFGLRMKGLPEGKIKTAVTSYLEMVKLSGFEGKYPRELSGGQRQRVGIARALAVEPEVLLLDEPFSALDPLTTEELHRDLLAIWEQTGKTVIMISHSLEEAVKLADRVGVMFEGGVEELFSIHLKRPRSIHEPGFVSTVEKIRKALEIRVEV